MLLNKIDCKHITVTFSKKTEVLVKGNFIGILGVKKDGTRTKIVWWWLEVYRNRTTDLDERNGLIAGIENLFGFDAVGNVSFIVHPSTKVAQSSSLNGTAGNKSENERLL